MRKASIPILAVLLSFSVYATARAELLGMSWSGELWSIDQETAEAVLLGISDGYELNAFAVDPAGRLVSVDGDGRLIFLDPSSGEMEDVVWLDLGDTQVSVRALAFSPDGWLYAVNWSPGSALFAIDPETGQGTEIGMLDAYFTQSLDFSPDGVLYGWGRDQGLYTIDTSTAEIADVNPVAVGPFLQSIVFAPDGELLGVRNDRGVDGLIEEIYEIDPATGTAAPQATGIRRDLRGLVFIP